MWRRFEILGLHKSGAVVVSDYGHHPTAVAGTIKAARELYPDRRIVLIFQPHHHHRTRAQFDEFAQSFVGADLAILVDVYDVAGREAGDRVDMQTLVDATNKIKPHAALRGGALEDLRRGVHEYARSGDLLLFMGAGDIDTIARSMIS